MSTHGDENTGVVETERIEDSEEGHIRFSPALVDESIKASLEPLHAQISSLTEMMDRLIQSGLNTESTTASNRGLRLQHESPYSEKPGSSRFPTVAPLTTAGYSSDTTTYHWKVDCVGSLQNQHSTNTSTNPTVVRIAFWSLPELESQWISELIIVERQLFSHDHRCFCLREQARTISVLNNADKDQISESTLLSCDKLAPSSMAIYKHWKLKNENFDQVSPVYNFNNWVFFD